MNVTEVSDLYLLKRNRSALWVAPDLSNHSLPLDPQPMMIRTTYIAPPLEPYNLSTARGHLQDEFAWIMALVTSPDGPPYRTGLPFIYVKQVPWGDEMAYLYQRTTRTFNPGNAEGFWLTGGPGTAEASLWRLFRAELDALGRWMLTLEPVRFSSRFPNADFSSLKAPLLKGTVERCYVDLVRAVATDSYRAVVTDAKNIVEAVIADRLGTLEKSRDFSENLQTVKRLLEHGSEQTCGWTYLEYHLAQKIRLVHGQTHATAPTKIGRSLRPEFALSVAEDLIELLTVWQFCKPSS